MKIIVDCCIFLSIFSSAPLALAFHPSSNAFLKRSKAPADHLHVRAPPKIDGSSRQGWRQDVIVRAGTATDGESGSPGEDSTATVEQLSEERKANLFQFLLRDLQVEGVPLLGVDADQVHTLQAALWTTLAELSEQSGEQKACLVFEDIPVQALRSFVDDFIVLKTQTRLIQHLPEMNRINVSLLGKGVGPAVLIEVSAEEGTHEKQKRPMVDENRCIAAMKMFVDRVVVGLKACPYTTSSDAAPGGLEGISPAPISYRVCSFPDVFHVLSSFWNCICELLASDAVGCTVLLLPRVGTDIEEDGHGRFAAVSELISRSLCLYRGDGVFDLLHFSPIYDRDRIYPVEKPAHGHIPPLSWLRAIVRHDGKIEEAESLSDADLALSNFQRRSPVTAVCIKRNSMMDAATAADELGGMVELSLGDRGEVARASGVPTYSRNAKILAEQGEEVLRSALEAEIAIANGS